MYQDERPFVSAKKVLAGMGAPYSDAVELLSFHSTSKVGGRRPCKAKDPCRTWSDCCRRGDRPGLAAARTLRCNEPTKRLDLGHQCMQGTFGECGLRGGYVEMTNIHPGAIEQLYKCASINLCPNTMGQVALSCLVNPPQPGDESYDNFVEERASELASLRRRAHMVTDGFNSLPGITCNFTEGAMYSFPNIRLPPKALAAAKEAGKAGDVFYCLKLLEATGICTVPGSGFGQEEGTFHLRTTILPREEVMSGIVRKFAAFHNEFMKQYA